MDERVNLRDLAKILGGRRALAVSAASSLAIATLAWLAAEGALSASIRSAHAEAESARAMAAASPLPAGGQVRGRIGTPRGAARPAARLESRAGAWIPLEPEDAPPRDYPVELRPNRWAGPAETEGPVAREPEASGEERPAGEEVLLDGPVSLEGSSEGAGEAE